MEFKRVAAIGTFDSQGSCTNWKGYSQALEARFQEVQYYDLINLNSDDIVKRLVGYKPQLIFCLLPDTLRLDLALVKYKTNCIVIFHYMDYNPKLEQIPLDSIHQYHHLYRRACLLYRIH